MSYFWALAVKIKDDTAIKILKAAKNYSIKLIVAVLDTA